MKSLNTSVVRVSGVFAQTLAAIILVCAKCGAQDTATLFLINKSAGGICAASEETILEDSKEIADLKSKEYVVLHIGLGHHVLQLKHIPDYWIGSPPKVALDLQAGESYYLLGNNHFRGAVCWRTFRRISKEQAEKLIPIMKPQSSIPVVGSDSP
jgi:hypothetical protein